MYFIYKKCKANIAFNEIFKVNKINKLFFITLKLMHILFF